mmetsp:Transcript_4670/g.6135  ORF Transcript_4670/g.6135 Transcript_4670/m.6135 type:complete len:178 (+) Transcript_4670:113-646(+)
MKLPTIFVNHGGGPLPLLGKQPDIVQHMKDILTHHLSPTNERPKSIIVISAHWETSLPIQITSSPHPTMYYDYNGFPAETYQYKYNAPGSPKLASKVQHLLQNNGIDCELNETRGYDHGVFVPLMIMYPEVRSCVFIWHIKKYNFHRYYDICVFRMCVIKSAQVTFRLRIMSRKMNV